MNLFVKSFTMKADFPEDLLPMMAMFSLTFLVFCSSGFRVVQGSDIKSDLRKNNANQILSWKKIWNMTDLMKEFSVFKWY